MAAPIRIPQEDPSTSSRITEGEAPGGEPVVSVVFGMTFAVGRDGRCSKKGYTLVADTHYEKARVAGKHTRPSLLRRDSDVWAWKNFTDLVIQGTARTDTPRRHLDVGLEVAGSQVKLEHKLVVNGDRWVDCGRKGGTTRTLSEAVPFTEMPLTFDRAYGGTDEAAEEKLGNETTLNFFVKQLEREENEELSAFSYPRNAAGKGYLVEADGAHGLAWPNLEFEGDRLKLAELVRGQYDWGGRPYPACFDWFNHAWFPRSAFVADLPPIDDDRVPDAERRLGLFEPGWEEKAITERSFHPFANGAHPYLCRHRFVGDEAIKIGQTSLDGRDFGVVLPALDPKVSLRLVGDPKVVLPSSLDLVFVEPDAEQVTLVWRATHLTRRPHLVPDWIEKSEYAIEW